MMPTNNLKTKTEKTEHEAKVERNNARKLAHDLMNGFSWDTTKQGNNYWFQVYFNLLKIALIDGELNE